MSKLQMENLISRYLLVCGLVYATMAHSSMDKNRVDFLQTSKANKTKVPSGVQLPQLVTRKEWQARQPLAVVPIQQPVNMSFAHHSAETRCFTEDVCIKNVQSIQNFHMDKRGWWDIGYNFLIGEDGRVYEGRGWGIEGAQVLGYNSVSMGFCIMGNFMDQTPNDKALNALKAWLQYGIKQGNIMSSYELFGHRDAGCTDCPGDKLYATIQKWPHFSHRKIPKHCYTPPPPVVASGDQEMQKP